MTIGLAAPIDSSGAGAFPPEKAFPPAAPSAPTYTFTSLPQEVGPGSPWTFSAVREPEALPSTALSPHVSPLDTSQGDFAIRVEGQLAFLRKAARRWHRYNAAADDLVQDTVIQALASAHQLRGDQSDLNLRGWLSAIMRHRFLADVVRLKRSAAALTAIAAADQCVPATASRPEARLMMRDVEQGLALLSEPQRTAIRLIGIDGRSYDEAGLLMGLSVAAVRCHLSRGRERLRELVEGSTAPPLRVRPPSSTKPAARRSETALNTTKHPEYV